MINGRYWLLDSAVECGVPLSVLAAPNIELALNRKGHGLSADEIAWSIAQMVSAGELGISLLDTPGGRWKRFYSFPEDRILDLVSRQPDHPEFKCSGYHLTKKGGAEWERWAEPDWTRFNSGWSKIPEHGRYYLQAILAATAPLAQELLELEDSLHLDRTIIRDSVRLGVRRPWRATYWRTLPEGFEFRFRTAARIPNRERVWERWCDLRKWYERPPR